MRALFPRFTRAGILLGLISPAAVLAQDDAAKIFKANCVQCHAANGSGDSVAGKALKAKDLRSPEVQKQTKAELAETITNGKDRMPPFGEKLKPEDIAKLVTYLRSLAKK